MRMESDDHNLLLLLPRDFVSFFVFFVFFFCCWAAARLKHAPVWRLVRRSKKCNYWLEQAALWKSRELRAEGSSTRQEAHRRTDGRTDKEAGECCTGEREKSVRALVIARRARNIWLMAGRKPATAANVSPLLEPKPLLPAKKQPLETTTTELQKTLGSPVDGALARVP